MSLAKDLMHPSLAEEMRRHKKKRLVQSPNSFFMDVKCLGCYRITTVFSHAQTPVVCPGCSVVLCSPSGGKCRAEQRRKHHHREGKVLLRSRWHAAALHVCAWKE
uniref:40S ribosomal protein S27 n=1 Tax=Oryzias latipes TaxID=8090 RepID=A0A3P9KZ29_ORYLA